MKILAVLLAVFCLSDARPSGNSDLASPSLFDRIDSQVIGGVNAAPGAWPWQLSQQRLGTTWSHSCGASLLSNRYALSAAHCVDGASTASLRVIAGLHDRSQTGGTVTSNLSSYKMHEQYNNGQATYANDIAILTFSTLINANGGTIQYARLPANNLSDFAGTTCVITGWGRTSSSQTLPNILQQANVGILSNAQCVSQAGTGIWANHICIKDTNNSAGACNGDSGGPVNCMSSGAYVVAGCASFVYQTAGNCLPTRPSVYTRSSTYLSWIATNTP